jgi:catechol-2,3-dioxygenase
MPFGNDTVEATQRGKEMLVIEQENESAIPVSRLNHAVLYVRDIERSLDFYKRAFGFEEIGREGPMAFLRAARSSNHHDLALFGVGAQAPQPPQGSVGLYHLAWEVRSIDELAAAASVLAELDALTGMSDHGATKSLYGKDPDGIEFEVMWMVPRDQWGEFDRRAVVLPLDLEQEVTRYGTK